MYKKLLQTLIFTVFVCLSVILFTVSCTSLKNYDTGVQNEAYIKDYKLVEYKAYLNNNEQIPDFQSEEEAHNYFSNLISDYNNLKKEVSYYRAQETEVPKVCYVVVDSQNTSATENPEELISSSKQNSRVTVESPANFFNSITTYFFAEGQIYDIYFTPSNITDIRLEAGENIINVVLGNPNAWILDTLTAYENSNTYMHVLLRPVNVNTQSDCIIITDKRVYYLRLVSTVSTAQMGVRWYYSYNSHTATSSKYHSGGLEKTVSDSTATDFAKTVSDLNFNYKIKGSASWKPERVYSDRQRTYIQFSNSFITNTETPVVYLKQGNEETLVNFSVKGITYIVPLILCSEESLVLRVDNKVVTVSPL